MWTKSTNPVMADHIRFVIWYGLWRYDMLMCCAFTSDSVLCRSAHIWKPVLSSLKIDPCLPFVLILLLLQLKKVEFPKSISKSTQFRRPMTYRKISTLHQPYFKQKSGVSVAKSLTVYPWVSLGCILVPPTGCSEKWRTKKNDTKDKQIVIWLPMMSSVILSNMEIFIYPRRENESFPDLPLQSRCEEYLPKMEVGWTTHSTWKKRLHISTIHDFLLQALWVPVPIGCGVSLQRLSDLI